MCLLSVLVSWGYMPRNGIAGSVKWKWKLLSHVRLFAMAWVIQSMEFSSPDYWSGLPSLLQGIFTTQGSNPGLPHCRWILYHLSNKGSPRILEWVISVQFSRSVMSDSLWSHGPQPTRIPCPSPSSGACSNSAHWVRDAIQLSHPLSSLSPATFSLSQHQGLF